MINRTNEAPTALQGKVTMVTGANAGMGKEIARALAKMGATVVMVSRDLGRGEAARAEVQAQSGNDAVELLLADLSSQQSIRHLMQEFTARHTQLHVLVNNVGVTLPRRSVTVDGLETVFATNHLAPFLLTNLLLPVLKASAPARVVTVSSAAHSMGKINFEDLQSEQRYREIRVYNQSKLASMLFSYELARQLAGTGVTANVLEPGFVKTNMAVPFPFSLFSAMRVSAEQGAQPAIYLASSPDVEGVSGKYFSHKGVATNSSKVSYDESIARRLWQISAELTLLPTDLQSSR
ncbi:MAG: SDR family oxidoreductase [Ktedonobacteraceae bacterium]